MLTWEQNKQLSDDTDYILQMVGSRVEYLADPIQTPPDLKLSKV